MEVVGTVSPKVSFYKLRFQFVQTSEIKCQIHENKSALPGFVVSLNLLSCFLSNASALINVSVLFLQDGRDRLRAAVGPGEEQDAAERSGDEGSRV